ncbi:MAG: SPOR domain-containing protein [Gammaproteobacteria bacterium]|jgi:cell division protein FtsN
MAQDYKHTAIPPDPGPAARGAPGWLWLVAGIAIGFGAAWALGMLAPLAALGTNHASVAQTAPAHQQPEPGNRSDDSANKQPDKPKFDFYKMLPSFEVVVPDADMDVKPDAPVAKVDKPGRYILQVGSFRNESDADKLRARLALLGVEASIQQVTIDNSETWHRVRVGPISDLNKLNSIRRRLADNDINALVVRLDG